MISALLFLSLLVFSAAQHPTCPNNQEPKLHDDGSLVQCLPGSSQSAMCGAAHACFFSGMNYMCCPSNEPSPENQPTCPKSSLTVLDSYGSPLKCSPRTRQCPERNMFCTDVGLAFICCEKPFIPASSFSSQESGEAQVVKAMRKVLKRRKNRPTSSPEVEHECPERSIGILDHYGKPKQCSASTRCNGFNQFCHGGPGGPICCEKIEYAMNKLDPETTTRPSRSRSKLINVPLVSGSVEGTGMIRKPNILASGEDLGRKSRINALPVAVVISPSKTTERVELPTLPPVLETTAIITEVETLATEPLVVFTTTQAPTTKVKALASRIKNQSNEAISLTRGRASELLNGEEKRAMAQRFLMHQIKNGWPYDDRFYRPDMDTFTNEQRQDIAKLRFIDN